MKSIKYILFLLLILIQSCESILEKTPLDKIAADEVWNSEVNARAYVTNLYSRISFNNVFENSTGLYNWCDEGTTTSGNTGNITQGTVSKTSEGSAYWDYTFIRDCNIFLERMTMSSASESIKNQLLGEVRVLRAFAYFEMMKRYGGVPLVDAVIDPYKPVDDKYTTRATEEEIANFIDSDLTIASSLLTDNPKPQGMINKWSAFALQARAMLWAASIAKYGIVQLNGIVGIPASKADFYYTKASAAADTVINSGKYSLYNKIPNDKSENYRNIFVDEGNSEIILEKAYDGVNIGHAWDQLCAPTIFATAGARCDPTLEFIYGYENSDGSEDLPIFKIGTQYTLFSNGAEPFVKKDPRLFGTIFFQSDKWSVGTIQSYDGLDPSPTPNPAAILATPSLYYQGVRSVGWQSAVPIEVNHTRSGFTVKKYIDGSRNLVPDGQSSINFIVFRLAEMYLTKAEAEFELGNIDPSVAALNITRTRAGISLVNNATISLDKIRLERRSELAFEGHRYWDLRRWRTALSVLNGTQFHGLHIYLHFESSKYYFEPYNCETFTRVYNPENYYNPITTSRINNNPKLVENPLY